jgi:hypothetical protein
MVARDIVVGLSDNPLSQDELEELLLDVERTVRDHIRKVAGRRVDELDIIVLGDLLDGGTRLRVLVDVRVVGRHIAPLSYDELLAEAIDAASRKLHELLRARREGKGVQ